MNNMKNIITYFGGKNASSKTILSYFPDTSEYDIYLELFGGSAAALLNKEKSKCEIYNDLDKNVYSLYKCVSDKKLRDQLQEKCLLCIFSEDLRLEYKELLSEKKISILDRAFYFWYVNRTSRNGNVNSSFRVDTTIHYNFSRSISGFFSSIEAMRDIYQRLQQVIFHNRDALFLLEKYRKDPRNFIYLDPPYHTDTRSGERYNIDFSVEQHQKLLSMLIAPNTKAKILLSGYYHDDYKVLELNNFKRDEFEIFLRYGKKKDANRAIESVWFNYSRRQTNLLELCQA